MQIERYKQIIKPMLTNLRYVHSINVSKAAGFLAQKYGVNKEKAQIAGILHDIMKDIPNEEQLKLISKYNIILDPVEAAAPKLWHAILGAKYIKNELGINDEDILNAIRYHTTARANMSMLEKVIFIADFISEDRDYDGVDEIRQIANQNIDLAVIEGVSFTVKDLSSRKQPIHKDTFIAYNELLLK